MCAITYSFTYGCRRNSVFVKIKVAKRQSFFVLKELVRISRNEPAPILRARGWRAFPFMCKTKITVEDIYYAILNDPSPFDYLAGDWGHVKILRHFSRDILAGLPSFSKQTRIDSNNYSFFFVTECQKIKAITLPDLNFDIRENGKVRSGNGLDLQLRLVK